MTDQCAIHGHEPIPENAYRVCGECWHAFATAEELVEADFRADQVLNEAGVEYGWWTQEDKPLAERRNPEQIYICPHCTHDF